MKEIIGFRAVYGERKQSHDLLFNSPEIETLAKELRQLTDKPPNSPTNLEWQPFIKGFSKDDYYVLIKTFPDKKASRSGMVLSEAIIYKLDEIANISDLDLIINSFSKTLEEAKGNESFSIRNNLALNSKKTITPDSISGLVSSIDLLSQKESPLVWMGQDGFLELVSGVWNCLWSEARKRFSFYFYFAPPTDESNVSLICTPESLALRWHQYKKISKETDHKEITNKRIVSFLLDKNPQNLLKNFIEDIGIRFSDWRILLLADECINYLGQIREKNITPSDFRGLINRIETISPNPNDGKIFKKTILSQFLNNLLDKGAFEDVYAINNIRFDAFLESQDLVENSIINWFQKRLYTITNGQMVKLFTKFEESQETFWKKAVRKSLGRIKDTLTKKNLEIIWAWWSQNYKIFEFQKEFLPLDIKSIKLLVETCPESLPNNLGESICKFSEKNRFFNLFAISSFAFRKSKDALATQLKVEKNANQIDSGIPLLIDKVPLQTVLGVAIEIKDERVFLPIAERLVKNRSLLSEINIKNQVWQKLSVLMLEQDNKLFWKNVSKGKELVYEILDLLISDNLEEKSLISFASKSQFANLMEYHSRKEIWSHLIGKEKEEFIIETAKGWWNLFLKNKFQKEELIENAFFELITSDEHIESELSKSETPVFWLIELFKKFDNLSQHKFNSLLNRIVWLVNPISQVDSISLGRFIYERKWAYSASNILSFVDRNNRNDLKLALYECENLIGFFDRFLSNSLGSRGRSSLKWGDWWKTFTETLIELYPEGPKQKKLWQKADGDMSLLNDSGNNRDKWENAIDSLINGSAGGDISTVKIIEQVKKNFDKNPKIELLEKLFYELGGKY